MYQIHCLNHISSQGTDLLGPQLIQVLDKMRLLYGAFV